MKQLPVLRQSTLSLFQACPRKFFYIVCEETPDESGEVADFGTAFHKAVETWHPDKPLDLSQHTDPMLRGMLRKWHGDRKSKIKRVLAAEKKWNLTIGGVPLEGTIDMIVETTDSQVLVVDHKVTSLDLGDWLQAKRTDRQLPIYYLAANSLGFNPDGAAFDMIGKPRALKTGTEADYEQRCTLAWDERYFTSAHFDALETEIRAIVAQIKLSEEHGIWPRAPHSCMQYNKICKFIGRCANG